MTSINPLQTTLHNLYNQIGANLQNTKPLLTSPNILHDMGLTPNLLQNLRNDLGAVMNRSNPERALDNFMAGLQQLLAFSSGGAKEWPADKEMPEGGKFFVKGSDGQPKEVTPAKEWPAGKELPADAKYMDFTKGDNGQPKEVTSAKEWPAGKELPADAKYMDFTKGDNGQPKEVTSAKEWPAGKELPADAKYMDFIKGENGQPKEVEASVGQRSLNLAVQAYTDPVVTSLKALLNAEFAGADIAQVSAELRSVLQALFDNAPLASNPDLVRNALRESIRSMG